MPERKPDLGTANGVDRSLKAAFAPDSPVDPELEKLIRTADGKYSPDEAADHRAGRLLDRLKSLPWDHAGTSHHG